MQNLISEKRGLLFILVIATVVIFIGLVWAISSFLPSNSAASPGPSNTIDAPHLVANCVAPVVFWVQHPEYYPHQLVIAGKIFTAAEIKDILTNQVGDLSARLQAQLIAAYLNTSSGADQGYIETTFFEAYGWLVKHPTGSTLSEGERDEGMRLLNLLEAYNLGETGVAPCDTVYLTQQAQTSVVTDIASVTATSTPSPLEVASSTETPTPTDTETFAPIYTYILPTQAATRTTEAPIYSSPAATQTTAPSATSRPSDTPRPPAPSDTPRPPVPTTELPTPPPTEKPTATFPPP